MKREVLSFLIFSSILLLFLHSNSVAQSMSLGIMVTNVKPDYARFIGLESEEGAYVYSVLRGSPAEKAGLKAGDVILEVDNKKIKTPQDFVSAIKRYKSEEHLVLLIVRGDKKITVKIQVADATALPQVERVKPTPFSFVSHIIDIDSSSFEREVLRSTKPVVAFFYAKWCIPCKNFVPVINEIASQYADSFKVVSIDVNKNEDIAKSYGIGGIIPSIILFNNSNEFEKILRVSNKEQIESLLTKFTASSKENVEVFAELGKEQGISRVLFVENSDLLISQNYGVTITAWDYKNGKMVKTYFSTVPAISPNGQYIALTNPSRTSIKIADILSEKEKKIDTTHYIEVLAISSDGKYIASVGREKNALITLKVFSIDFAKLVKEVELHGDAKIEFSPDSKFLAVAMAGTTQVFDTKEWEKVASFSHPNESFREFRFTPDSRYLFAKGKNAHLFDLKTLKDNQVDYGVVGFNYDSSIQFTEKRDNSFEMIDTRTKEKVGSFKGHIGPVNYINVSNDRKFVISGSLDGSVRLWDINTRKELAQFVSFKDGEWIVITPEGYYNSSLNGHKYLKARVGKDVYTIEQFYDVFYRPDIVSAKLRNEDITGLITLTLDEAIKNPPPVVELTNLPTETDHSKVNVCYKVKSTGGGIGEVRVFHNGKLVYSDGFYREVAKADALRKIASLTGKEIYEQMRGIAIVGKENITLIQSKTKGEIFEDCVVVDAVPEENEISVAAFNRQNSVQGFMKTRSFKANIKPEEPHLYVLSIGVDKYKDDRITLKYAVKDALDIASRIKTQASTIYNLIHVETLVDQNATKKNILNKINEISQKIKPTDSFILFVAGHGILLQNQYYMLTHDFDGTFDSGAMISSNEIIEISKKIKSLSQLFIFDTCHAGGVDYIVSGLYDARISVLAKKMGLHIYASASSIEQALDGYKGNGLFTFTLLDGLNNKKEADLNDDKKISIIELGGYAKRATTEISGRLGHSQTPLIINFGRDNWVYGLK